MLYPSNEEQGVRLSAPTAAEPCPSNTKDKPTENPGLSYELRARGFVMYTFTVWHKRNKHLCILFH